LKLNKWLIYNKSCA